MRYHTGLLLLAVLGAFAFTGTARADRLDSELNSRMPDLVDLLKRKSINYVGVMRFRVKEGDSAEHFGAPISGRLVDRLETLLVIHGGPTEEQAIGVIKDAGTVAASHRILDWWTSKEDRARLFDLDYPLAWGEKKVKADAFITGMVTLSADRLKTTVLLEYFDRKQPETMRKLAEITLDTDRFILRDLAQNFGMSKKSRETLKAQKLPSQDLIDQRIRADFAAARETRLEPRDVAGVSFEMIADGTPANIREVAKDGRSEWVVNSPRRGSKIQFRLKNLTDARLAVVVRLNGCNLINEATTEPEISPKFVLMPKGAPKGQDQWIINGFLLVDPDSKTEPKKVDFQVLTGEAAARFKKGAAGKSDRAGLIEVMVFQDKRAEAEPKKETKTSPLLISRGLPPSKEAKARESYLGLRDAYLKNSKLTTKTDVVAKREVIVPDHESFQLATVKVVSFPSPAVPAGNLSVRILPGGFEADTAIGEHLVAADALAAVPRELKKVHILMVFDTSDPQLKDTLDIDEERLTKLWNDTIPSDLRTVTVLRDDKVTREKILEHYRKLKVGPDEGLVFFYGGHGATNEKTNEHFFQLRNSQPLVRSDLRKVMLEKKAGLTVLMTDCCSTPYAIDRAKRTGPVVASRGATTELHPTMRCLLFRSRGVADITAATDNAAWSDRAEGGLFTRTVAKLMDAEGSVSESPQITDWGEFSRKVQTSTEKLFQEWREEVRVKRGLEIKERKQVPLVFHKTWAVVGLANSTKDPIRYRFRWSDENAWRKAELAPGKQIAHSRPVDGSPGSKAAPTLQVEVEGSQPQVIDASEYTGVHAPTFADSTQQIVYRQVSGRRPGR